MSEKIHIDEERLLEAYFLTRSKEDRNRAVEAHLRYAAMIARRFSGKGVEYDELYQVASLSMVKAMERFDPQKDVKFTTFAMPTMAGEVKNYFRDRSRIVRMPRGSTNLLRAIEKSREALEQTLLRSPTPEEIAKHADLPFEDVVEALAMSDTRSVASLDAETGSEDDGSAPLSAILGGEDRGYADFELRDALTRAMRDLTEQERKCLHLRFFENRNQREAADALGVSQMTVSRMERRLLEKLRNSLGEDAG